MSYFSIVNENVNIVQTNRIFIQTFIIMELTLMIINVSV